MAQRGWTTANEAELLRRVGWQFAPDVVVVQYFMNDAYPSAPDFRFDQPERTYLLPEAFWKGYVRTSSVAALASLAINGVRYGLLNPNAEGGSLYGPGSPGYLQFKAALAEIGDSARARDTPVLFVLFPSLVAGVWTPETYPLRSLYRQVAADAEAAGLQPFDLTAAFADRRRRLDPVVGRAVRLASQRSGARRGRAGDRGPSRGAYWRMVTARWYSR